MSASARWCGLAFLAAQPLHLKAQHLPLPEVPYQFEELEPYFHAPDLRRHYKEVFGHHVERFNRVLKRLQHTTAYRQILKRSGIDGLLQRLAEVPKALQRRLRYHAGGYVNHELFFRTLRPASHGGFGADAGGVNMPEGHLLGAIEESFGSFASFKDEFNGVARQVLGSGWAWLVGDRLEASRTNSSAIRLRVLETPVNDHPLQLPGHSVPLLCLDLWEHAHFGQFFNDRQSYIEAWWRLVNWEEVGRVFASLELEARLSSESPVLDFASDASAEWVGASAFDFDLDEGGATLVETEAVPRPPDVPLASAVAARAPGDYCLAIDHFLKGTATRASHFRCTSEASQACSGCLQAAGVSASALAPGEVLFTWSDAGVLRPRGRFLTLLTEPPWAASPMTEHLLGALVAALLAENRRTDSPWHHYIEFLHDTFTATRWSALFWPQPLLRALNASVGLTGVRAAARAHKTAKELLKQAPELLGTESGDPGSLLDTELHWAVATAACRAVQDPRTGGWLLLPGSELLGRGDKQSSNVEVVPAPFAAGSEDGLGRSWRLVVTRRVLAGQRLVVDAAMSNPELLAHSWASVPGNAQGPLLSFPGLSEEFLNAAAELADGVLAGVTSGDLHGAVQRACAKWRDRGCHELLLARRLQRRPSDVGKVTSPSPVRRLGLCLASTLHLVELAGLDAFPTEEEMQMPESGRDPAEAKLTSKDVLLQKSYELLAEACGEAMESYRAALSALGTASAAAADLGVLEKPGSSQEELLRERFRWALSEDEALLQRCVKQAQRNSIQRDAVDTWT